MTTLPSKPQPSRALATAIRAPSPALIFAASREQLPALEARVEKLLTPMGPPLAAKLATMLIAQIPKQTTSMRETSEDHPEDDPFVAGLVEELARYPEDIGSQALVKARRTFTFTPSIAEMVQLCDELMKKRRDAKKALRIKGNMLAGRFRIDDDYFWMVEHMGPPDGKPVDLKQLFGRED